MRKSLGIGTRLAYALGEAATLGVALFLFLFAIEYLTADGVPKQAVEGLWLFPWFIVPYIIVRLLLPIDFARWRVPERFRRCLGRNRSSRLSVSRSRAS